MQTSKVVCEWHPSARREEEELKTFRLFTLFRLSLFFSPQAFYHHSVVVCVYARDRVQSGVREERERKRVKEEELFV